MKLAFVASVLCLGGHVAMAQTRPATQPYVDPSQLNVPFPAHDHYKQPMRAFLETRSGFDFLNGVGIVQNEWSNLELTVRLLAECGFKTARMEVPFGDTRWDETALTTHDRYAATFGLCKAYGIRPTILLNAHHGSPAPMKNSDRRLAAPAAKGDRTVRLTDVSDLTPGYSGLSQLGGDFWAAKVIFTGIDAATGVCKLSRPLPVDLPTDKPAQVTTLKYRPLYPVGSKEFDETVAGWLRYVEIVCRTLRDAGIEEFDLEIWNELTFGSNYLDVNLYYDPPLIAEAQPPPLRPAGRCWELSRRTIEQVKARYPKARVIWGFSNITFYHTPIEELPAGMDAQSYHPYGTGTRQLEFHEQHKDNPQARLGPPPPVFDMRLPEGYAATFIQTECLFRLTGPQSRHRRPKETRRFYHYKTEHGVFPVECDVTDERAAWRMKSKSIIRAFSLWLNKGVDAMHWFCAASAKWDDFGILPRDIGKLAKEAKFDEIATPPMRAIRNLTRCFAGAQPLTRPSPLKVDYAELTEPRKIFDGVPGHPPLWERECFAFLPFQLTAIKFVIPVYVMTYDVTKEHPGSRYRLIIRGLPDGVQKVSLYDPLTDQPVEAKATPVEGALEIEVPVVDYPRVLTIE